MKKLFTVLFAVTLLSACVPLKWNAKWEDTGGPPPTPVPWKINGTVLEPVNSAWSVAMGASSLTAVTVATLPASPSEGQSAVISDGADATDCTVGGGTTTVECLYSEGAWVSKIGSASGEATTYEALAANSDIDTDLTDGATASTVPSSAAAKAYADSLTSGDITSVLGDDSGAVPFLYQSWTAFTAEDTTPDVSSAQNFRTVDTTTISGFDHGAGAITDGRSLTVYCGAATVIDLTTSEITAANRSTDYTCSVGDVLLFVYYTDQWYALNIPDAITTLDDSGTVSMIGTAGTNTPTLYALDTDLSSVSASDDTLPSAKATKAALDAKAAKAGDTYTGAHDFGGATSVEVPNGANPTTDAAGEVAVDTDDHFLEFYSDASRVAVTKYTAQMTIWDPDTIQAIEDAVPLLAVEADWAPHGITIVDCGWKSDAAVTMTIGFEEWTSPADGSPSTIEDVTSASDVTEQADDGTLADAAVAAGSIVMIDLDTDALNYVQVWITYFVNPGD